MSNFGPQESLDFWNECVQNESLFDLMSDPRIRMVSCRDYILDKQKEVGEDLSRDHFQNYESDMLEAFSKEE